MRGRLARGAATALGCGCLLGAGGTAPRAAEWSIQPVFGLTVDEQSNRLLNTEPKSSQSVALSADVPFMWALENMDFSLDPHVTAYRYSDPLIGNGADESLRGVFDWQSERAQLQLTGSVDDTSTLVSELQETGIIEANTYRHTVNAGGSWVWSQTETRQLVVQGAYSDVYYHGEIVNPNLVGYQYPTGSIGERWILSERTNITVSAFGDWLMSDTPGNSSHEAGLEAELKRSFTEKLLLDAAVGVSERYLVGSHSVGTNVSATLTDTLTRGSFSLSYSRSLVPYGIGYLVERQQASITGLRNISPYLDGDVSLIMVKNGETAVLLGLDRESYDNVVAGLTWHFAEHWSVRAQANFTRAALIDSSGKVNDWGGALNLTWTPKRRAWSR